MSETTDAETNVTPDGIRVRSVQSGGVAFRVCPLCGDIIEVGEDCPTCGAL